MGKTLIKIKNINVFVDCPGVAQEYEKEGDEFVSDSIDVSEAIDELLEALCSEKEETDEPDYELLATKLAKEHGLDKKTATAIAEHFFRWKEDA